LKSNNVSGVGKDIRSSLLFLPAFEKKIRVPLEIQKESSPYGGPFRYQKGEKAT
jgi:hypothetical protein